MPDYRKLVDAKERFNTPLLTRMDADVRARDLMRYILRDEFKRPISGIINVTLNRPAVFYANVFSALNNAHEQIIVESNTQDFDTHEVEDFRKAGFEAANNRLRMQGRFRVEPFMDEQSCIRGRAGNLVLFQMKNGKLVPDIRSWDMRFVSYEMSEEGIKWAGINEKRDMDLIVSQYPEEVEKFKINTSVRTMDVLDVWDTEGNEVWIGNTKIIEQEHNFGFTPVVIEVVTLGSMLSSGSSTLSTTGSDSFYESNIAKRGESIFFLIRDIVPQLNRLASIVATQSQTRVKPPIQTPSTNKTDEPPDYPEVMDMGSSSSAEGDSITRILDTGDIGRAASVMFTLIDTALQEGSLSSSDLGILGSPPPSGITLIQIKEGRDQVFSPRLELKSNMKLGIGNMFTKQVLQIGGTVELDGRKFSTSKLEGQYTVRHDYNVRSKATDAGLVSLAAAYGNLISDRAKRRDILQREDYMEDEDELRWQEAEFLSPLVKLRRTVESLIELGADEDARLLTDEAGIQLDKLLSGDVEERKPEPMQEPKQVVSLFGGQGGRPQQQPTEEV